MFLGIILEKFNIEQNLSQIAFAGRIVSIIFFNLSLFIIYKIIINFNVHKIVALIFIAILMFNIDMIYWGHKVHPDLLQFFLFDFIFIFFTQNKKFNDYYIVTSFAPSLFL